MINHQLIYTSHQKNHKINRRINHKTNRNRKMDNNINVQTKASTQIQIIVINSTDVSKVQMD